MIGHFALDPVRIGVRLIHLVDGNDDRDIGSPGMVNGFLGLRHDTVIGSDDDDRDIGNTGTAGPHGGKRFVTRCIQKCDPPPVDGNLVRTDMLGNTAGFAAGYLGGPDGVKQGCLAVVNVTHDGNDRRPLLQQFFRIFLFILKTVFFPFLDLGRFDFIFQTDCFNHVIIQRTVDGDHLPGHEENLDQITGIPADFLRQFPDGNPVTVCNFMNINLFPVILETVVESAVVSAASAAAAARFPVISFAPLGTVIALLWHAYLSF